MSISLSFAPALDLASAVFNGMLPVYLVPLGVALGIGILGIIIKAMSMIRMN
jgi:hypothetical protein